jgi:hypothetical protein
MTTEAILKRAVSDVPDYHGGFLFHLTYHRNVFISYLHHFFALHRLTQSGQTFQWFSATTTLLLIAGVAVFKFPALTEPSTALRVSENPIHAPKKRALPKMSQSIPFLKPSYARDGSMAEMLALTLLALLKMPMNS